MLKKILILGCGYLGYNLADYLSNKYDVTVINRRKNPYSEASSNKFKFLDMSLTNFNALENFDLADYIVINAIGSSIPTINIYNIGEELKFYENLTGLLLYLSKRNIKHIIQISSGGTVYGNKDVLPISENQLLEPTNVYALQKIFFEGFLKVNFFENKIPYTILRVSNPYGGYQILNKQQGVIPIILTNIIKGTEMGFWADLNTVRDYIYISDLSKAFEVVINNDAAKNETYNVGNGVGATILEVIKLCEKVTSKNLRYVRLQDNVGLVNKNILDITKLEKLGFSTDIALEEGIRREYERLIVSATW